MSLSKHTIEVLRDELIQTVVKDISENYIYHGDYEAADELLRYIPDENLIAYLSEKDQEKFVGLLEK